MESIINSMTRAGTTLYDDKSQRLKERPLSQPQTAKHGHLYQAPGRGQGFDDFGSSFAPPKRNRPATRVRVDSDDEIDLISSAHDSDEANRVHKANTISKGKGKAKANDEREGVVISGKHLPYHEDYKPRKLPNFKKNRPTTSGDDPQLQAKSKSPLRPKPKPAFLGSSLNPIPIAVADKPNRKSKPLTPTSSRTSPLHDRSPNRPSATISRPKPRAANRGAKKSNPDPFRALSPLATDLDSPPTVKGKRTKKEFPMDRISPIADRRVENSSSFPDISPLASSTRTKPELQQFPDLSPLLSHTKAKVAATGDDSEYGDDELGMHSDDDILTRGGPRPFPMSTQVLKSIQPAGKRLSSGNVDARESKKMREDDIEGDDVFMASSNCSDTSQDDDSLFLDPSIDPSTICPYCDESLPPTPTPHLLALLVSTAKKSYTDPRPSNPKGLKAPLATFIAVCQRHRFESVMLPEAKKKKWPRKIHFEDVRGRVEKMKGRLEAIVLDGGGGWDSESESNDERNEKGKGPRGKSVFWKEIIKEVKKKGSRAVVGVSGQFASFEKTQPGYYGELGSVIIHQTLYSLFPPSSFDPTLIAPLTPTEFIQRILVPEAAVGLIIEDREMDPTNEKHKMKAVKILRESAAYGVAMFPDADTNCGPNGKGKGMKDEDDWDMGVGDEIVRERARARRKELEEEERLEEEIWAKNEMERVKKERGGDTKMKGDDTKSKVKREVKEKEHEVVVISGTSDGGRLRPRPRKLQRETSFFAMDEVPLPVNASDRKTSRKKNGAPSKKQTGRTADINLCSTTSDDTNGRESWTNNKGKGVAKEREASDESMSLQYPTSDDMSIDGSNAMTDDSSNARWTRIDKKVKKVNTRKSDSDEYNLQYPSPSPTTKPLTHNNSIVSLLSEDEEATPQPKKAPPNAGAGKSRAPLPTTSNVNSSYPLQVARNRSKAAGGSEWCHHLSPQPTGIDDDGNASDDSDCSIRDYISPVRARQKNKDSWLLSQSSTTSTQPT